MSTLAPASSRDVWAPRDSYRRLVRKKRKRRKGTDGNLYPEREKGDLYVQLVITAGSRAPARVQVVVVDERGELAVDGVLDRRVHGAVDVSRELGDQPGLHIGPESLVGIAPV